MLSLGDWDGACQIIDAQEVLVGWVSGQTDGQRVAQSENSEKVLLIPHLLACSPDPAYMRLL